LGLPLNVQKPKVLQLQEGFAPDQGSALDPAGGLFLQTSATALAMGPCSLFRYWELLSPLLVTPIIIIAGKLVRKT